METPQVIDKIKKLLASAGQKDNANEAAAAFAQAQRLATKHRIELAQLQTSSAEPEIDPMVKESINMGGRVLAWKKVLIHSMQGAFGVYCIVLQGKGEYVLAGKSSDVQTALYLYHAISAEIERLAARIVRGKGASYAHAFKYGAAETVSKRIAEAHVETVQAARAEGVSTAALACVEQGREIARAWYMTGLGDTSRVVMRQSRTNVMVDGFAAGRKAGESIDIGGKRGALPSANRVLRAGVT
jgi:hypothetical protein